MAKDSLKRLKEAEVSSNWGLIGEEPCKLFTMQANGRTLGKGEGIINYKIDDVIEFLCNDANASSYV